MINRKKTRAVAFVTSAFFALSACETIENVRQSDVIGGVIGAGVGYAACKVSNANDTECALLALGGAVAGVIIARQIDKRDVKPRQEAVANVVENGQQNSTWKSAESGNSGELKLLSSTTNAQGQECRKVSESYNKAGETITEEYTMCKTAEDKWETV